MKLIEVDWIDSNSQWGWTNIEKLTDDAKTKPLLCRSAGYLIADEDDRISLIQSMTWHEKSTSPPASGDSMITIPRVAIVTIRKLRGGRK